MKTVGIVIKAPAVTHATFKRAAERKHRPMSSIALELISGWLDNGAPSLHGYGSKQSSDNEADQKLVGVLREQQELIYEMRKELKKLRKEIKNQNSLLEAATRGSKKIKWVNPSINGLRALPEASSAR